jgi:hypothetical protein
MEACRAVGAIADLGLAGATPTVIGEAIRVAAIDDLAQHVRDELVEVSAVHACKIKIAGAVRLARGAGGEPLRVRAVDVFARPARVHARQHGQALLARHRHDLAVQVAIAQRLGAAVQRVATGVVGDDAAGVDDNALHACAPPMLAPPSRVVAGRVDLGEVGLRPTVRAPVPRHGVALVQVGHLVFLATIGLAIPHRVGYTAEIAESAEETHSAILCGLCVLRGE